MKYFTPEILARFRSEDDDVSAAALDEWEVAIKRYHRRIRKIKPHFPEDLRRFKDQHVCLHDAEVFSMGRQDDQFVMLLETEPPASKPVILTFTLEEAPVLDTTTAPDWDRYQPIYWEYEEWDLDRRKRCTLEVILSNGWLLKLVFRDFHYLVAEPFVPSVNGKATQPAAAPVPRSA